MDLLYVVLAIVALVFLILIHEFGHFIACKMVGITVLEFGIGFPPRLRKLFNWGETEFTLNWLPLGGFVLPYGENFVSQNNPEEMQEAQSELERRGITNAKSVFSATPLQKIWFLFAGPFFNFIAAYVLFVMVALSGLPVLVGDVTIAEVFPESAAAARALRPLGNEQIPADVVVAVNGQTFDTSADLEALVQEAIETNPAAPLTFTFRRNDPVTGISEFDTEMLPNLDTNTPQERVRILEVQSGTPADSAGLQPQDLVIAVNGEEIKTLEQLQDITAAHEDVEIVMTVDRSGELIEIPVTPALLDGEDRARIGIQINILIVSPAFGFVVDDQNLRYRTERLSIPNALVYGGEVFGETLQMLAAFPGRILRGEISGAEARPVSPVGVVQIGAEIINESDNRVADALLFTAFISIALGITNLLPIPALDGGRILFVVVEIIRGKPLAPEREGVVHLVGFALLIMLSVVLIINDIVNPISLPQ